MLCIFSTYITVPDVFYSFCYFVVQQIIFSFIMFRPTINEDTFYCTYYISFGMVEVLVVRFSGRKFVFTFYILNLNLF